MKRTVVEVDERTITIDNMAGNVGFRVMIWLLLIDLGVHGLWPDLVTLKGFPLDIPVILCAGGLTWAWYRVRDDTISRRRFLMMLSAFGLAAVAGVGLVLLRR